MKNKKYTNKEILNLYKKSLEEIQAVNLESKLILKDDLNTIKRLRKKGLFKYVWRNNLIKEKSSLDKILDFIGVKRVNTDLNTLPQAKNIYSYRRKNNSCDISHSPNGISKALSFFSKNKTMDFIFNITKPILIFAGTSLLQTGVKKTLIKLFFGSKLFRKKK